jgi:hypothetical protein
VTVTYFRERAGSDRMAFAGVPVRVFAGRVEKVLQFMAEGQLEPSGVLLAPKSPFGSGRVIATIEVTDDLSAYSLPGGTTAVVAIYTGLGASWLSSGRYFSGCAHGRVFWCSSVDVREQKRPA